MWIEIQVGVVESLHHPLVHRLIERHHVHHHSCLRVDRAAHQNLDDIIVSMAVQRCCIFHTPRGFLQP